MKEGRAYFTDIQWPMIGLVIFFLVFAVMVFFQQKQYQPKDLKRIESLPFEGENT